LTASLNRQTGKEDDNRFGLAFAQAAAPGGQAGGTGSEMAAFQQVIPLIYQFAGFYPLRSRPREKGL